MGKVPPEDVDETGEDTTSPVKPTSAAVRRALVEGRGGLIAFLRRRLRSAEEAEEVLQIFILRALEHAEDLRNVRSVRAWLSRILATTIVDYQRRTSRRRKRETALPEEDVFGVEAAAEVDEAVCDCLYKLLPTLKPEYADVIWRVDLLGEPRDRVAASLGTSLNNINVRLHRARQALKMRLEEMCLTCPIHGFLDCRCDEARRHEEAWARRRIAGQGRSIGEAKDEAQS